jgi:diguanylate cyclase (GGDEF)-like protein
MREPLLLSPTAAANPGLADALSQPVASAAIRNASIGRRATVSAPLELSGGSPGFVIAVPVEARAESGEVATLESRSAMVGLIDGRALLAQAFQGAPSADVRVDDDGGAAVGELGEIGSDPVGGAVPALGRVWTIEVSRVAASTIEQLLPWLILALGLALAVGVAAALRSANRRRDAALHELELSIGRVERVNQDLEQAHAHADHLSRTDSVTGVFNRRHFTEMLTEEMAREAPGPAAGVLLLDLDHFKAVNDEHGHLTGDAVLRATAERIAVTMRATDCLARWGGEEFVVLAPRIGAADLGALAERIRGALADREVEVGQLSIPLTLSVGGVLMSEQLETPEAVVAAADLALYDAKSAGRNCVRMFNSAESAQPA